MNRRHTLLALASFAAACERSDEAVDPVWGKQPCAHCAMLVGDRRYAAQAVDGGERRFFDDVGCMASWFEGRGEEPAHAWVRDAEAARWVDVRRARFAPGAKTPMDFGFEAREGGPLGWAEVRERVRAARRGP